jgi:glutathione-specific gamma-glutamylcyclotransferase
VLVFRSTDHRGTPDKPGLVCTVIPDEECETVGIRKPGDPPSSVHGVAYLIPPSRRADVLDELDFR